MGSSLSSFISGDAYRYQASNSCLEYCFSNFLILWQLNIALWWANEISVIDIHNYNLSAVMNHNVNTFGDRCLPMGS